MTVPIFEAFSVSHVGILDGSTGAEEANGDVYGVDDASMEADTDSFENTGDDRVLSVWEWFNFGTLSVRGGYIPFATLGLIYGEPIASSGTTPNDWFSTEFWTDRSLNVNARPVLVAMPSKDKDGVARTLYAVLYKVQFGPIAFDGPSYKEGLKVSYNARIIQSDQDEAGNALTGYVAPGRLVSAPAGVTWADKPASI